MVNLIQFGFPLGIGDRQQLNRQYVTNHSSATNFSKEVQEFINTEIQHGALLGPFPAPPHDQFHCSPMMTRPKDGNKRRVIVDLSYGEATVNGVTIRNSYEDTEFNLQLPSLDHVLYQVFRLNHPKLVKADISRAFRNVPIDPRDAIKCDITFQNQFYVDKFLVFGSVNGTMKSQNISDAIRHMLRQDGMVVWNYIDDAFAAWEAEGSYSKFSDMCQLM